MTSSVRRVRHLPGLDGVNLLEAFTELANPFDVRDLDEVVVTALAIPAPRLPGHGAETDRLPQRSASLRAASALSAGAKPLNGAV